MRQFTLLLATILICASSYAQRPQTYFGQPDSSYNINSAYKKMLKYYPDLTVFEPAATKKIEAKYDPCIH